MSEAPSVRCQVGNVGRDDCLCTTSARGSSHVGKNLAEDVFRIGGRYRRKDHTGFIIHLLCCALEQWSDRIGG